MIRAEARDVRLTTFRSCDRSSHHTKMPTLTIEMPQLSLGDSEGSSGKWSYVCLEYLTGMTSLLQLMEKIHSRTNLDEKSG